MFLEKLAPKNPKKKHAQAQTQTSALVRDGANHGEF